MLIFLLIVLIFTRALNSFSLLNVQMKQNRLQLGAIKIGLTREQGTNEKLKRLLPDFDCIEIPCIMFDVTAEKKQLGEELTKHDLVIVTSPQSATVLIEEWEKVNKPSIKVVTIGKGTSKPLEIAGIQSAFEPSDSTGENLANELPSILGSSVLYPCSALADNKILDILTAKGFKVKRLNSYTTVPAVWSPSDYDKAKSVDIVTFASPSTIRVWKDRIGVGTTAVSIGITSYKAAVKEGFKEVYYPQGASKGLEPWAELIEQVARGKSMKH